LPSKADLEPTLQNIKKFVDNGEFDRLLEEPLAYGGRLTKKTKLIVYSIDLY